MLKCYIVEDLLPGYTDGLLSKETTAKLELHLKTCENCRSAYEKMQVPVKELSSLTADKEVDYLKKVRYKTFLTSIFLFIAGIFVGFAGVFIGEMDNAPGAGLIGIVLMIGLVAIAVRSAWRKR
jgi:F0F1-type ATP synthase assembly protein I